MTRRAAGLFLLILIVFSAACDKVPLMAPTQSTITLSVNTTLVPINGTVEVVATVLEQAGTPVQNGTLVTFTSNSGVLEPIEARTDRGIARTTFRGTTSGVARIGAFSGGARVANDAQIEIRVGSAGAGRVVLRADPPTVLSTGGSTTITATVFDTGGNPLPGAPITFTADAGQLSTGQTITDGNGEARAVLTTARETRVTAAVGGGSGSSGVSAEFTVRVVALPSVSISTSSTTFEAGLPITFTVTPTIPQNGNPIRDVVVIWGDGQSTNLGAISSAQTVQHIFDRPGPYTVTARITDTQGLSNQASLSININERSSLQLTMTATPNPVNIVGTPPATPQQGLVEFTATVSGLAAGGAIQYFAWDFGDGSAVAFTSGGATNHRYTAPGTYRATVVVRANNGQEGFSERTIRVNP